MSELFVKDLSEQEFQLEKKQYEVLNKYDDIPIANYPRVKVSMGIVNNLRECGIDLFGLGLYITILTNSFKATESKRVLYTSKELLLNIVLNKNNSSKTTARNVRKKISDTLSLFGDNGILRVEGDEDLLKISFREPDKDFKLIEPEMINKIIENKKKDKKRKTTMDYVGMYFLVISNIFFEANSKTGNVFTGTLDLLSEQSNESDKTVMNIVNWLCENNFLAFYNVKIYGVPKTRKYMSKINQHDYLTRYIKYLKEKENINILK